MVAEVAGAGTRDRTETGFVLVSTHQVGARQSAELMRLIGSLPDEARQVSLHCLLQGVGEMPGELAQLGPDVVFSTTPGRVPLARARNLLLESLAPDDSDYLLFPDDDCWFQPGFFGYLAGIVETTGADLVLIRNNDPPAPLAEAAPPRAAGLMDVLRRINSNNIVIAAPLAARVGMFDERFGLGTPLGGGEDTDYALRAYRMSRRPVFVDTPLVGHRSLNGDAATRVREMQRYWPGVMLHTLENLSPALVPLAGYRVAAGLFLLLTRRMSMARFALPFRMWLGHGRARLARPGLMTGATGGKR